MKITGIKFFNKAPSPIVAHHISMSNQIVSPVLEFQLVKFHVLIFDVVSIPYTIENAMFLYLFHFSDICYLTIENLASETCNPGNGRKLISAHP